METTHHQDFVLVEQGALEGEVVAIGAVRRRGTRARDTRRDLRARTGGRALAAKSRASAARRRAMVDDKAGARDRIASVVVTPSSGSGNEKY